MEASVVIGSCASAPPLPLQPVCPGPAGSLRGGSWRGRLATAWGLRSWLSAALVAGFPAPSSLIGQIFVPAGATPGRSYPGRGAEGRGPERCPESKPSSLTATPPGLRPQRSSLPGLGRRRLERMVHCAAPLPAQDSQCRVSAPACAPPLPLSDSMLACKPRPALCQHCAQNSPFTIAHQPLILRACLM